MDKLTIHCTVNGQKHRLEVKPNRTLLDILRDELGLTGTKKGCGTGDCGCCTVLVDGSPVNSCLVLAGEVDGSDIVSIEGLAENGRPDQLQAAFVEHGAVQCGFCTPGTILTAKALLSVNPDPDELEIKKALTGNLCRCTGYFKIIEAVRSCAGSERPDRTGER